LGGGLRRYWEDTKNSTDEDTNEEEGKVTRGGKG